MIMNSKTYLDQLSVGDRVQVTFEATVTQTTVDGKSRLFLDADDGRYIPLRDSDTCLKIDRVLSK